MKELTTNVPLIKKAVNTGFYLTGAIVVKGSTKRTATTCSKLIIVTIEGGVKYVQS